MHVVGGIILSLQINDFTFFCGFIPSICFISPLISTHTSPQPILFLSRPPPCLLIDSGADDLSSAGLKKDRTARSRKASALLWSMLETRPVPIHFTDLTLKTFETNTLAAIIQLIFCIFHVLGGKMITHAKVIWVY